MSPASSDGYSLQQLKYLPTAEKFYSPPPPVDGQALTPSVRGNKSMET